jgi:hypothetical protein
MADVICLSPSHLDVDGSLGICVGESWREFESRYFGRLVEAMRRIFADEMGFICLRASASDRQRRRRAFRVARLRECRREHPKMPVGGPANPLVLARYGPILFLDGPPRPHPTPSNRR